MSSEAEPYQYTNANQFDKDFSDACEETFDKYSFLPHGKVDYFVTEATVRSILQENQISEPDILVEYVLAGSKRVFLLLVLVDKVEMLCRFKDDNINDSSLPIGFDQETRGYSLEDESLVRRVYSGIKGWRLNAQTATQGIQAKLIAPVFDTEVFSYRFDRTRILPYLIPDKSQTPTSSGFFGEVVRREIHPQHLLPPANTVTGRGVAVAVKTAKNLRELVGFAEKEANNLEQVKLHKYKSNHLIRPIAAYQIIDTSHCLIFPWADGGHLDSYWEHYAQNPLHREDVEWIIGQFAGLFCALEELHLSGCRHGDLKPDNILWFRKGSHHGTLQIADLGLATFHGDKGTDIREKLQQQTMTPSGTKRYEPPEEHKNRNQGLPRSRAYDIWSMGCSVLELLVWLLYGREGVVLFRKRTSNYFWRFTEGEYFLDSEVEGCIGVMRTKGNLCPALESLLDDVEKRLLVIEVSKEYKESGKHRAIASAAAKRTQDIFKEFQNDPSSRGRSRSSNLMKDWPERGVVYQDEKKRSLVPPILKDAPKGLHRQLPSSGTEVEDVPGLKFSKRAPTLVEPPSAPDEPQITYHNQVSQPITSSGWSEGI